MRIGRGLIRRHMDHHGQVVAAESALLAHGNLTAAQLFVWRAEEVDVDGQIRHLMEGRGGQEADGAAGRMAAAVADFRQGVVFGKEGDAQARLFDAVSHGLISCRLAAEAFRHSHAGCPASCYVVGAGMEFLAGDFRVIGDCIIEGKGLRGQCLYVL